MGQSLEGRLDSRSEHKRYRPPAPESRYWKLFPLYPYFWSEERLSGSDQMRVFGNCKALHPGEPCVIKVCVFAAEIDIFSTMVAEQHSERADIEMEYPGHLTRC